MKIKILFIIYFQELFSKLEQYIELVNYRKFSKKIKELCEISKKLKPNPNIREDCFDRYYINDYVESNKNYIKGDVLEFCGGNVIYAKKYGKNPNIKLMTYVGHKDIYSHADYYADLDDISTLPEQKFDCIIATQVIMYNTDPIVALNNLKFMLKPKGVLILTVPGPLFHHSKNTHHMFSFTEESLKYMVDKTFHNYQNFRYYGNLEYTMYMLFWMKKNPYIKPTTQDYIYTLEMGITAVNE